tara:strand:- start:801 stop:1148 length:348 start_codon:yes stop_codon:yes gene_type:complete
MVFDKRQDYSATASFRPPNPPRSSDQRDEDPDKLLINWIKGEFTLPNWQITRSIVRICRVPTLANSDENGCWIDLNPVLSFHDTGTPHAADIRDRTGRFASIQVRLIGRTHHLGR